MRIYLCEIIKFFIFVFWCFVVEGGWFCCGSEKGDFVVICFDGESDESNNFYLDLFDFEVCLFFGYEVGMD